MTHAPVSVVIPTFNSGHLVTEAVGSLLAQTLAPAEIVVVDDGSADDTRARLAPYLGRVTYVRQENRGVSAARNRGVRTARHEFVAFLDADDVWHPRKLEIQFAILRARPALGLLGTRFFDWPAAEFPDPGAGPDAPVTAVRWGHLVVKNYVGMSSVLVRRSVLDRAGPFDTRLQGPEDRDLWLRVAAFAEVGNVELRLTGYRHVEGSVSRHAARCEAGMRAILGKLEASGALRGRPLLRRKAYSYLNNSCGIIYANEGRHGRAARMALASLAWYPFPYGRDVAEVWLERPKRLAVAGLRLLGLKPAAAPAGVEWPDGLPTALERHLATSALPATP